MKNKIKQFSDKLVNIDEADNPTQTMSQSPRKESSISVMSKKSFEKNDTRQSAILSSQLTTQTKRKNFQSTSKNVVMSLELESQSEETSLSTESKSRGKMKVRHKKKKQCQKQFQYKFIPLSSRYHIVPENGQSQLTGKFTIHKNEQLGLGRLNFRSKNLSPVLPDIGFPQIKVGVNQNAFMTIKSPTVHTFSQCNTFRQQLPKPTVSIRESLKQAHICSRSKNNILIKSLDGLNDILDEPTDKYSSVDLQPINFATEVTQSDVMKTYKCGASECMSKLITELTANQTESSPKPKFKDFDTESVAKSVDMRKMLKR